ncbi:MAG: asparaginase [Chloroflexia bacterium]|nr:asparaginase [Chloroflexia bacterium]
MLETIVEVTRGGRVESSHQGIVAVVDSDGALVASAGDPDHVVFFRSSAKPFQAVPLVECGAADVFGFTPAELALCCASHVGTRRHQLAVAAMLAKLGLDETALRCGTILPADRATAAEVLNGSFPRGPLACDCSGKHTGIIATCLHLGESPDDYLALDHPAQRRILGIIAEVCRVPEADVALGIDGCSLPTFGASMRAFAASYATLAAPERAATEAGGRHAAALTRLRDAMIAHPANVSGDGRLTTTLMLAGEGRIVAKGGAEGLFCFGVPERGVGVAIRMLDGSTRGQPAVTAAILEQLDLVPAAIIAAFRQHHPSPIVNHNGMHVGDLRATVRLAS